VAIKIASETTVAENQTNEQTDSGSKEGGHLLTTREMGTTRGTRQMDPGICFHPVYVISHTQNVCAVNIANSSTNDAATPEGKRLAQHIKDI